MKNTVNYDIIFKKKGVNMFIKKLRIENFKTFGTAREFELKQSTIIVGNNGVGKTTIIEALNLALTGNYRGKSVVKNLTQDLFNKDSVKKYLDSLKTEQKQELPKILISIFFDTCPEMNGDGTPDGSAADGFTFSIEFDEKFKECYQQMIDDDEIESLPIEFYQVKWTTFSRASYYSSKFIGYKGLLINSDNFSSNNIYTSQIIKSYFDDDAAVRMSQAQRRMFDGFLQDSTVQDINTKISESDELKERNVSLGITSVSKTSWESLISAQIDNIPFDNVGKGEQCIVKTYLSFSENSLKNKAIIMIEEPECHLSFGNLNKLLSFIKTKLNDYQVIITTHSSFVLNKLGINNLLLLSQSSNCSFDDFCPQTVAFFEKRSGYDTLRFLLSDKAILVEGDSDDLIIQRAYLDKYQKLPIEDGVDIITVGLSFLRFLEIAKNLKINTYVVTDNDGDITALKTKYQDYDNIDHIKICYSEDVVSHKDVGIDKEQVPNLNTLEPELLRANSRDLINEVLEKSFDTDEKLLHYMIHNKTEVAYGIFMSATKIKYPVYIMSAIEK